MIWMVAPVRLELPILSPNPGLRQLAWRLVSDLRCLPHEGAPAHLASLGRHDREAVWPRWRASGDGGESPAQAATDRLAPCSPAGAEPDAERPAAVRILVDIPQSRTYPKGCHRPPALDAPGVSSSLGPLQVPPAVFIDAAPQEARTDRASTALIQAIVELKSRNPCFGCPRIARIISHTFGVDIDKNVVSRVLAKHYRPAPGGTGPSWLSFIGHTTDSLWSVDLFPCESIVLRSYWVLVVMDQFTRRLVGVGVHRGAVNGADLCRMFNAAIHGRGAPLDGEPSDSGDRRNQDCASRASVTPIRGAPDRDSAARISRPCAVLECP